MWRDVWMSVSNLYYDVLHSLEDSGSLDPSNILHLFCAHYVFLPRLQRDIDTFTNAWNDHSIRTEQNLTPNQLWEIGLAQNPANISWNIEVYTNVMFLKHKTFYPFNICTFFLNPGRFGARHHLPTRGAEHWRRGP